MMSAPLSGSRQPTAKLSTTTTNTMKGDQIVFDEDDSFHLATLEEDRFADGVPSRDLHPPPDA